MTGKPGRSGGKREGAGRPVQTRTLRTGMQLLYHELTADNRPLDLGEMVTVEVVSRTKIILRRENGAQITLGY